MAITFGKLDSTTINNLGKRIVKFFEFGAKTASECAPFGVDCNPIKGMTAIHSQSSNNGESVIIGYINTNQLADVGESRLFSVDDDGNLKAFIWNKKDGKLWLNGDTHTCVRFLPLQTGLNNQNTLINLELAKIATAIGLLGGSYTVAPVSTNITSAESVDVLLK